MDKNVNDAVGTILFYLKVHFNIKHKPYHIELSTEHYNMGDQQMESNLFKSSIMFACQKHIF